MNYKTYSNEDLLSRYQDLDVQAFEEFFRRNGPIVFNFLALRLRNQTEAEEVLQDTFLRIHKYILKYNREQNALNWVFAIAKNCAFDQIKRRQRQSALQADSHFVHEMNEAEIAHQQNAQSVLKELLNQLPPQERRLLEARYLEDVSYELLAQSHEVSPAGMRQRISRLIRKVKPQA